MFNLKGLFGLILTLSLAFVGTLSAKPTKQDKQQLTALTQALKTELGKSPKDSARINQAAEALRASLANYVVKLGGESKVKLISNRRYKFTYDGAKAELDKFEAYRRVSQTSTADSTAAAPARRKPTFKGSNPQQDAILAEMAKRKKVKPAKFKKPKAVETTASSARAAQPVVAAKVPSPKPPKGPRPPSGPNPNEAKQEAQAKAKAEALAQAKAQEIQQARTEQLRLSKAMMNKKRELSAALKATQKDKADINTLATQLTEIRKDQIAASEKYTRLSGLALAGEKVRQQMVQKTIQEYEAYASTIARDARMRRQTSVTRAITAGHAEDERQRQAEERRRREATLAQQRANREGIRQLNAQERNQAIANISVQEAFNLLLEQATNAISILETKKKAARPHEKASFQNLIDREKVKSFNLRYLVEQLTPSRLQGVSPKTIRLAARILKAYREGGKIAAYRLLDFNELNKVTAKVSGNQVTLEQGTEK